MDTFSAVIIFIIYFGFDVLKATLGTNVTSFGFDLSSLTAPPIQTNSSELPKREAAYLLNNAAVEDSAILAFSVYAYLPAPITLQVYRPISPNDSNLFKLVSQLTYTPSVQYKRENVYVESLKEKCIRVKAGDRLAIYSKTGTLGVQYIFNSKSPKLVFSELNQQYTLNSVVSFPKIPQPYEIYASAFAYKLGENEPCVYNQMLPENEYIYLSTPFPITGKPGIMGATGNQGIIGPPGFKGPKGDTGSLGARGSTGAVGGTGSVGSIGLMGDLGDPGSIGPLGNQGDPGQRGVEGFTGPSGARGPRGPPGRDNAHTQQQDGLASTVFEEKFFTNPKAVWGAFIWAAILSIIALVTLFIIIAICCVRRRIKEE